MRIVNYAQAVEMCEAWPVDSIQALGFELNTHKPLVCDGKVGPKTWAELSRSPKPATPAPTPPPAPPATETPDPVPTPEPTPEPERPASAPEPPEQPEPEPTPPTVEKEPIVPTVPVPPTPDVILPANVRSALYLSNWGVGIGLSAAVVGYVAAETPAPTWLLVAIAVYGVLSSAVSGLARANTHKSAPA